MPANPTDTPIDENKRREREEPGTTGQEGAGDAGRSPTDLKQKTNLGDSDHLSARKTPYRPESEDADRLPN